MRLTFDIYSPDDLSAGIRGFTETIVIDVESGDPGGEEGEFTLHMRDCLQEWFDGARIVTPWRCAKCGKPMQFFDGICFPCNGGKDPGD